MHESLFEPFRVRQFELPNRVVVPPMFQLRPITSPAGIGWYRRLAAGGAGLVIVEGVSVHRFGDDLHAAGLRRLAEAIHAEGSLAAVQVGLSVVGDYMDPADIPREQIEQAVRGFATAARVCRDAGFDGIQPHGAHAFLLSKFFMPGHNRREDEYGGSLENRSRLALNIVRAVREAVGDDLMLLFRHSPEGEGHGIEQSLTFARWLVEAGVDVLDLSPSTKQTLGDLAAPFKRELGAAVIAVGEMEKPENAERALAEGCCDLVAVGRQLIADAAWPRKVREGRLSDMVWCDKCGEGCYGQVKQGKPVYCKQWRQDEVAPFVRAG